MGEWTRDARCASGEDGIEARDFQVPLRGDSQNKARLVCVTCPVQQQCLVWALENAEIWGVWGGLDEAEIRRALSVDATGKYVRRCRPPGCPDPKCRARPSSLHVSGTGRNSRIECLACGFTWKSPTSAAAILHYQKSRLTLERRRARLRRVPLTEDSLESRGRPLSSRTAEQTQVCYALVASGGRR